MKKSLILFDFIHFMSASASSVPVAFTPVSYTHLVSGQVDLGFTTWSAQSLFVVATCALLIIALWLFFGKTLYGRALRATAVNRRGARLVGISTTMSGSLTFTLATAIGAMSGMLIAPITTVYYLSLIHI